MEGRIGKYEIQTELGRGGFGRVYRSYDPAVGRPVAIKVLTSEGEPELLARFRAEAGMTGKLQHKNIVTVFDCGEQNGSPYIVMEYLEGENLQSILQSKRNLGLLEKMRIIYQIAEGLHYAHESGVIHRDVKPANIMLLPNGTVKIMDFGIARLVNGQSTRTRSGDLIGTTSYMAPEQFRGAEADVRSDIFAYGVICYELLSGVHPFQANAVSAIIYRIMSVEAQPLREIFPECPEPLDHLIHRALAKDRDRRYASLDDVLIDAEPIVLDLRREQAVRLMLEVHTLIDQKEFDRANSKLKQALELDPLNRDARRVKDSLRDERNRRLLEENIQSLEREGSDKLAQRQFPDALQSFETALRLKPGDSRLQARVADSRARMLANREASLLLSEAKRESQNQRFPEAKALAIQAMAADPDHPQGPALIKHLEDEIDRAENEKRLQAGIDESERLLLEGDYDGAMAALRALESVSSTGSLSGSLQIGEFQNRIRARQMEDARRKRLDRLESEVSRARVLVSDGRHASALEVLDALQGDFPGVSAIKNLRASIQEQLAAGQRATSLTNTLEQARGLLALKDFPKAVSLLEGGLNTFPDDGGLQGLLEAAKALNRDADRQKSLLEIGAKGQSLRKQNRLEDALDLLGNGLRMHGNDAILSDMCRGITMDLEDRRSCDRLLRYRSAASDLLTSGSVADALATLREASTHYPAEPSLELLLATAEEHFAKQSEQEIVASILRASTDRENTGDLAAASKEIAEGLRLLPASKELLLASANLRTKIQSAERESGIQRLASEIRQYMDSGEWEQAGSSAAAAKQEYPDQIVFDELATQIQTRQRAAETEKAMTAVRQFLQSGDLESAAIALAKLEPAYGSDEIWKAEKRNLDLRLADLASKDSAGPVTSKAPPSTGDEGVPKRRVVFAPGAKVRPVPRFCLGCKAALPDRARFCDTCGKAASLG